MYRFQTVIRRRPDGPLATAACEIDGLRLTQWLVPPHLLCQPLPVSFDELCRRLTAIPRVFVEPDGSFTWCCHEGQQRWQVDGSFIDRDEQVVQLAVQGFCQRPQLDALLRAIGWPDCPLLFEWIPSGVLLEEDGFRRLAEAYRQPPP